MNEIVVGSTEIRKHYRMDVIPLRYAQSLDDLGRPSFRKALVMAAQWLQLIKRVLLRCPDIIYYTIAPTGWALVRDLCYVSVFKLARIPIVFHIHGGGISQSARNPFLRAWIRWAFGGEVVIHLSPSLVSELRGLASSEQCRVLPNGVGKPCMEASRGGTKKQNGEASTILFVSNMMTQKGPLVLVEAMGILARKGIEFTSAFAGPAISQEFERQFWEACRREGVLDRVEWKGARYGSEKADMFASAGVFAFPTLLDEGVPLALLEAMSYGLPSVASNQGGIPDVVEDGATGFLTPRGDPAVLADRLERLLIDRELREAMGTLARRRYQDRYTLDQFERGLVGILSEAMT